jgi:hypothetical protein
MTKVLTHMCMSLDGFVAQVDDNPAELFDWYWDGDIVVPSAQETMSFSVDAASASMLQELLSAVARWSPAGGCSTRPTAGATTTPRGHPWSS